MQLAIVSRRDRTTIITIITTMAAGKGGNEKRKSNNEGRLHSCSLLRIPTTLSCGEKGQARRDGFETSLCSENRFSENIYEIRNC